MTMPTKAHRLRRLRAGLLHGLVVRACTVRPVRKVLPLFALAVVLLVAVIVYFRVGWDRMVAECELGKSPLGQRHLDDVPFYGEGARSVAYSWQWSSGFTCTYSNGKVHSSYWF